MRMTAAEKMENIKMVEQSPIGVKATLEQIGIYRITFYAWYDRYVKFGETGLEITTSKQHCVWNKIPYETESQIIDFALESKQHKTPKYKNFNTFPELRPKNNLNYLDKQLNCTSFELERSY